MLVMSVGIMRVPMPKPPMSVAMCVRLAGRIVGTMGMSVVQIVPMLVSMCHRLVLMFVLVPFGQM